MTVRQKVALVLGGGGARGLAHIGALKVLEEAKIPVDLIVGSSIGALVGAAYAISPDAAGLQNRVAEVFESDPRVQQAFKILEKIPHHVTPKTDLLSRLGEIAAKEIVFNMLLVKKALLSEEEFRYCVAPYVTDIDIADTQIPFFATAVDLISGQKITLHEGPLIPAVMASCAVPGFMPPVCWQDMQLVDGGVVDPIPATVAREKGSQTVIGVDVSRYARAQCRFDDGVDVVNRVMDIMMDCLSLPGREQCDILIEPAIDGFFWTDFSSYSSFFELGEAAAMEKIDDIRQLLQKQPRS